MSERDTGSGGIRPGTALVIVVAGLLLGVVALEVASRLLVPNGYFVWPPNFRMRFDAARNIPHGVTFPGQLTINAAGMRGDLPNESNEYRILAVGGSTTICVYLDDAQAWPFLLQQSLNRSLGRDAVWVGNVGRPGHRTDHHVVQVEKLLAQYPEIDMVVLLVGINDLITNLPFAGSDASLPRPDARQLIAMSFSIFPGWDDDSPWYRRNVIGRIARVLSWRPMPGTAKLQPIDEKGEFVAALRRYRKRAGRILHDPPDLEAARAEYVANLNEIIDIARASNVRILLMTQPTLWKGDLSAEERDMLWGGGPPFYRLSDGATYYSIDVLAAAMKSYNDALLQVCEARGVECLDAAQRIEATADNLYDDAHFTERGSAILAELVAGYLLERPPWGR